MIDFIQSKTKKIMYDCIAGYDPRDNQSVPENLKTTAREKINQKTKTIGVPWHLIDVPGIGAETLAKFKATIEFYKARHRRSRAWCLERRYENY